MVEPITVNVRHLSQDVRIPQEQVQAAIDLIDAGCPVPFIARYRKEVTKNLNEESLRQIEEELHRVRALCERKQTILKTIEAAGKLTPELDKSIREAKSVKRLEDTYLPFKPKRHFLSSVDRNNDFEPFALEILAGTLPPEKVDERAAEFVNEDKNAKSVADVLLGTGHIIADIFRCNGELVHKVRELFYQYGRLTTAKIETEADRKKKAESAKNLQAHEEKSRLADTPAPPAEEIIESAMEGVAEESHNETQEPEGLSSDALEADTATHPEDAVQTDTQEVSELFQRLKEAQSEKGLPVVRSQNALKKKKRADAKKKQDEIKQRRREHFERQFAEYFDFSTKLRGVPAHRILAFNRGEKHKIIQVGFKIDEGKILESVKDICVPKDHIHAEFLACCLQDALQRGVLPMLKQEIRNDMTEYAEKHAVKAFGKNLRNLLLQRPLSLGAQSQKRVLALDPNSKNGCVAVALDEFGNLIGHETILVAINAERRAGAERTLADMIRRFGISAVGIGSGGGSRAVEEMIARVIETHCADTDLSYMLINRFGSVAYSASQIAQEEFPNESPFVRAAVFIGRRLQNPINELVKIEPANLGAALFQHEIRGKYLKKMLAEVVESCVNLVGVDLNTATPAMLAHTAGLNLMTARRIYEYRREHGQFRTRDDLKKVPGINETVYTHAAGFLRITGGDHPLDSTNIHPENYELAAGIIEKLGFSVNDLQSSEKRQAVAEKIVAEKIGELTVKLSSEFNAGLHLVRDTLEELSKPGYDPREVQPPLMLRKTPLKFENLTAGMELTGTIQNITDFGAFVDIGLHETGFVHISQMVSGYIQDAHEKVAVGDTVRLWVTETDAGKKRVALTLLPPGTEKRTHLRGAADRKRDQPAREHPGRPPRSEGERRDFSDKARSDKPWGERPPRDSRNGKRGAGGRSFERSPKTFATMPIKKEVKPITEKMKQGKEPMRSFADLAQLFGRVQADTDEGNGEKK